MVISKSKPLRCKLGFHFFTRPLKALYIHGFGLNGYVDICIYCSHLRQQGSAIIPKYLLEKAESISIDNWRIQKHIRYIHNHFNKKGGRE